MFSAALRRYVGDRPFDNLKQRLLYALARHVAGYGNIFALAGDFVYLIDINYAAFGFFNIEIGSLYQSEQDVFDILADIAGFGQRCGVGNGERYVDRLCKRLCEKGFARAGRSQKKNVLLGKIHI